MFMYRLNLDCQKDRKLRRRHKTLRKKRGDAFRMNSRVNSTQFEIELVFDDGF